MSTNTQSTDKEEAYKVLMASVTADAEADSFSTATEDDIVNGAAHMGRVFLESMLEANEKNGSPVPEDTIEALAWAVSESAATSGLANNYVQRLVEEGMDAGEAVDKAFSNENVMENVTFATRTVAHGGIHVVQLMCEDWLKKRLAEVEPVDALEAIDHDLCVLTPQIVASLYNIQTVRFDGPNIMYMTKPPADLVAKDVKEAMKPYFDFLLGEMDKSERAETMYHQLVELIDRLASKKFDATSFNSIISGEGAEEEPENVTLAAIERDSSFQNHSLGMKSLSGLEAIARGEKSFQLSPRSSDSKETYELTAIQVDCEKLFSLRGVSTEHVRSVLQTVYDLRTSHKAEGFISGGRIWFTTGTILKEMLRTTGGTIREPGNSKAALKVIDAALMAASGARIRGVGPDGKVLNVDYFLNAVRRDKVTYRGVEYRDVWGFLYSGNGSKTLNDYAMEIGQAHYYPLLDSSEPLEFPDVWIYDYLLDMLNEAGGRLYPSGTERARRTSCTVKRAWETIFEKASPMKALDSRKKKALVGRFDAIAQKVVVMAKNGEVLRNGKPLYVKAKSERDAGRGRGAGAWRNLVLECHADTVKPTVDLLG